MSNKYEQVETGIYKYVASDETITYHERPWVNGKRTYRALGFNFTRQNSLKLAREEYHRRKAEVAAGGNPYAELGPINGKVNGNGVIMKAAATNGANSKAPTNNGRATNGVPATNGQDKDEEVENSC